jgi:hypothetical protein
LGGQLVCPSQDHGTRQQYYSRPGSHSLQLCTTIHPPYNNTLSGVGDLLIRAQLELPNNSTPHRHLHGVIGSAMAHTSSASRILWRSFSLGSIGCNGVVRRHSSSAQSQLRRTTLSTTYFWKSHPFYANETWWSRRSFPLSPCPGSCCFEKEAKVLRCRMTEVVDLWRCFGITGWRGHASW